LRLISPSDNYSIAYSSFVPVIVKAVQEQQTQIDTQEQNPSNLFSRIDHPIIKLSNSADWSDKVFGPSYQLRPLSEVANFIEEHQHLPELPSAQEMMDAGLELVNINALLLQKIEELTLYQIEQEKSIK
jgi:hypothetical protein